MMAGEGRRGFRLRSAALYIATGTALAAALAACGSAGGTTTATVAAAQTETLKETGSSLLAPLMGDWVKGYEAQTPGASVTAVSSSSGTGIKDATSGSADIGTSDAYLSSGDLVKKPTLVNIPLAVSAQTVIYNLPGVSGNLKLNGTILAEIYQGKITSWDDPLITSLNPHAHLPAAMIVPVVRKDRSGDTFLFTSYLSTQYANWDATTGYGTIVNWPHIPVEPAPTGSTGVLNTCKATPGCIAYNGISYLAQALQGGLGEAALANYAGNYTLPTATAITAGLSSFVSLTPPNETISLIDGPAPGGYPIINYEYAVVSTHQPSAAKASAIRDFLTWIITKGNTPTSAYLDKWGFQPLPSALVTLGETQIGEISS
jgi:phosphate transport system substrate-binding protein